LSRIEDGKEKSIGGAGTGQVNEVSEVSEGQEQQTKASRRGIVNWLPEGDRT
jgi:hypothetical protein